MSRYIIKKGSFNINIGWDASLGYYYLFIEDGEEMVWSNLDQKNAFQKDIVNYKKIIHDIVGIDLPSEVTDSLAFDRRNNTGNYEKVFELS